MTKDAVQVARDGVKCAKDNGQDVAVIDTAGRLHIDDEMMTQVADVAKAVTPHQIYLVCDAMTGQDAVNSAKEFNSRLELDGIILTKLDGDARGGAALSVKAVTGKPIKFIGVGEKVTALEPFHPDRIASRILGMGDVLSLVEEAHRVVDKEKAEKLAKKLQKGKGFDLADFRDQLLQMTTMGGLSGLMDKLPGMANVPDQVKAQVNDKEIKRLIAIVDSMTPQERRYPAIINGSRKKRIARGSGTHVQDINKLLKQFTQMQKVMKKMSKGGMAKMLRGMRGQIPPGIPF
jgi:signal recognition particle subunit SRP54